MVAMRGLFPESSIEVEGRGSDEAGDSRSDGARGAQDAIK